MLRRNQTYEKLAKNAI